MARPMTVCDSVVIAASPAVLYALISDPTAVSRWSPENTGATVDAERYLAGNLVPCGS